MKSLEEGKEWEKEFDKKFPYEMVEIFRDKNGVAEPKTGVVHMRGLIKSYISFLLHSQSTRLVEKLEDVRQEYGIDNLAADMKGDTVQDARARGMQTIDKVLGIIKREDTVPYNQADHSHCWAQKQPPACGIPLEIHKVCCLCELPVRK